MTNHRTTLLTAANKHHTEMNVSEKNTSDTMKVKRLSVPRRSRALGHWR
jgi:hypothetical protein